MHPRDERAITQVVGHVDALLVLVPASASAASLGVYLTPNERRVLVLLRHKERFVRKLLALEEPVAVFCRGSFGDRHRWQKDVWPAWECIESICFCVWQLNR